uniref:Uncharacterized protein n=1 Tax=Tanacetum cinerariifolium TaxID=118510 RepID=A0A699GE26_TANCI|nr:hypothetical protein [Tanacetum cinerariifolium]
MPCLPPAISRWHPCQRRCAAAARCADVPVLRAAHPGSTGFSVVYRSAARQPRCGAGGTAGAGCKTGAERRLPLLSAPPPPRARRPDSGHLGPYRLERRNAGSGVSRAACDFYLGRKFRRARLHGLRPLAAGPSARPQPRHRVRAAWQSAAVWRSPLRPGPRPRYTAPLCAIDAGGRPVAHHARRCADHFPPCAHGQQRAGAVLRTGRHDRAWQAPPGAPAGSWRPPGAHRHRHGRGDAVRRLRAWADHTDQRARHPPLQRPGGAGAAAVARRAAAARRPRPGATGRARRRQCPAARRQSERTRRGRSRRTGRPDGGLAGAPSVLCRAARPAGRANTGPATTADPVPAGPTAYAGRNRAAPATAGGRCVRPGACTGRRRTGAAGARQRRHGAPAVVLCTPDRAAVAGGRHLRNPLAVAARPVPRPAAAVVRHRRQRLRLGRGGAAGACAAARLAGAGGGSRRPRGHAVRPAPGSRAAELGHLAPGRSGCAAAQGAGRNARPTGAAARPHCTWLAGARSRAPRRRRVVRLAGTAARIRRARGATGRSGRHPVHLRQHRHAQRRGAQPTRTATERPAGRYRICLARPGHPAVAGRMPHHERLAQSDGGGAVCRRQRVPGRRSRAPQREQNLAGGAAPWRHRAGYRPGVAVHARPAAAAPDHASGQPAANPVHRRTAAIVAAGGAGAAHAHCHRRLLRPHGNRRPVHAVPSYRRRQPCHRQGGGRRDPDLRRRRRTAGSRPGRRTARAQQPADAGLLARSGADCTGGPQRLALHRRHRQP